MMNWIKPHAPRTGARVRTPTVLQMEALECGAASLAIVLAYFGRYVPLEELRVACGVSRDGSKAGNVLKAARNYGLIAKGMRFEIETLREQKMPVVVFWNFNHFLVVEGFGKDVVYLNDPGCGPRQVSHEEFSKAYTGVTLVFEPGLLFRAAGHKRSLLRSLLPRLQGSRSAFAFVMLASLALVIPGLVVPVFTQIFVDDYLIGRMDSWVKPLLLGMALTAVLRAALTWIQQSQLLRMEMRLSLSASSAFFWHVLRLPVDFFNQRYAGDIAMRTASNDRIAGILAGDLATNLVNVISLLFYLVIMLQYDGLLTLVGVLITGINLATLNWIARLRIDGSMRLLQDQGKLMATTMGGIQTIETVKASGGEYDFFMRWSGFKAKVNNSAQQLELYTRLLSLLPALLTALVGVVLLGLGGAKVMAGEFTVGMLVAFQSLMSGFSQPVTNLMGLAGKLQDAQGDLARLDDVLHYPLAEQFKPREPANGAVVRPLQGHLTLSDITFGYSRLEPPLIEHFSLELAAGKRIAVVGGSGSGKSTIAKLVMGVYQPWSGKVLLDGMELDQIAPEQVHACLAGVDQDVYLFEGSVRDNLTLWDSTLPEADMVQAARDACIHDVIVSRSGGYDGDVGEAGANFSGGQGQRLEIARALATNPRILVLDESTASLDPVTEKLIDEQIRRRACACLIVAHRLSTIRDCDEIIVMERGCVVERGTHDELLALGGHYHRLIHSVQ
jgi:NHLM bacteriocin system ABC transporter peptidase/ATP-binding protein